MKKLSKSTLTETTVNAESKNVNLSTVGDLYMALSFKLVLPPLISPLLVEPG
jgi:hypothetical protein